MSGMAGPACSFLAVGVSILFYVDPVFFHLTNTVLLSAVQIDLHSSAVCNQVALIRSWKLRQDHFVQGVRFMESAQTIPLSDVVR